jgi:hypothetical protein
MRLARISSMTLCACFVTNCPKYSRTYTITWHISLWVCMYV